MQFKSSIFAALLKFAKHRKISLPGILLLLTYVVSIFPLNIFHHHEQHIIAFEKANDCEKYIFYGDMHEDCHHDAHVSKKTEKCAFCDDHTVTPHLLNQISEHFFQNVYTEQNADSYTAFILQNTFLHTGRGPPAV